ncbi:Biotin carboxyl carrier protein of acetyl-CoA carboxylase [Neobacillus rhizosphaerae]|uniref:Biotin carboxyl carrier protein of acetyl-CoA carboxylase n=1 Tax=Neobacillus rhizosphaerae TaxID=2880965 RepID=A0ABM9EUH5_9BACI|nr:acetyl-CoA carboxylase biotin carboxyl carrier protein [Neobacillus rhizosphaerae]CAH2716310.1 Biotin carboxyl carrier protein of acetyl-CoA carboxylase [Neobacillus rhizosphaerae]
MLKVQEIRELIKLVDQSSIDEFVYEIDGSKIKMKKNGTVTVASMQPITPTTAPAAVQTIPVAAVTPAAPAVEVKQEDPKVETPTERDTTNLHKITSPMVGTFYASPTPDSDEYVKVGSNVSKDSIVCIVEAMKLFNEIEAEVNGEIVEVLVKNGQLVEYGQPLFLVKP